MNFAGNFYQKSLETAWLRKTYSGALMLLLTILLSGCGIFSGEEIDKTAGWSANKLYAEAHDEMAAGNWSSAIKLLEKLQARYPFGRYAQQALMEIAYCQYKDNEPALALASATRFIKQYPNHPNVDYVYYLRGLVNFNDNLGLLASVSRQDLTERDPKALRESFDSFKELVVRFPDSKYTPDASLRMGYLVNALAANEVHVADYYLKRKAYVAAANRAKNVLTTYQQAPAVQDALEIMIVAYDALGMTELRDDAQRVLQKNFPNHQFTGTRVRQLNKPWWQIW